MTHQYDMGTLHAVMKPASNTEEIRLNTRSPILDFSRYRSEDPIPKPTAPPKPGAARIATKLNEYHCGRRSLGRKDRSPKDPGSLAHFREFSFRYPLVTVLLSVRAIKITDYGPGAIYSSLSPSYRRRGPLNRRAWGHLQTRSPAGRSRQTALKRPHPGERRVHIGRTCT